MQERGFRERLGQEFEARRQKNARYSLRAFAAFLGTDHSTLSQILNGSRRMPVRHVRPWARRLGMDAEEAIAYVAAEHVPDTARAEREEQLRHWTAEAMSIVTERVHWEIVRLCRTTAFRYDCRRIAGQIGTTVDEVNLALSRLLRLRLVEVSAGGEWRDTTDLPELTEKEFRKLALARVRQKAAEVQVRLPSRESGVGSLESGAKKH
jgi:transcriptional regulator with XRE-family HTH domain